MTMNGKYKTGMVKTPEELLNISKASAMGDKCYEHILTFVTPGMTEIEVTEEIEKTFLSYGAEGLSFPTICVSGVNTMHPHGEPSDKKIEKGDFVTIDMGAVVEGYCGDMTRTFAMGSVTAKMAEIYDVVLSAQTAALNACRAGVRCFDIDKIARDIINQAGYGEYYIHGTGHGVGKDVHEAPTLNSKSDEILEENMPVTVEPGIYIPDEFGVRIEDLAIITDFGIINTVKSPKELMIL